MQEASLRTSCGEGFLRPAECAGKEGRTRTCVYSALPRRVMIGLIKGWCAAFWAALLFASRHVGVVATCIFASILQSKAPAYRHSGKNPCSSMLFANNRRGYGPTALDLQGYSRSLAFIVAPDALGYVEYSQKCTVLRGGPSLKKATAPSKYAFEGAVYAFGRLRMRCQTTRT